MSTFQAEHPADPSLTERAAALVRELARLGRDPRPEVRERVRLLQDELRLTRLLLEVSRPLHPPGE